MAPRLENAKSNVSNEVIANYAVEAAQAQREIDEAAGKKRSVLKRAKSDGVNTKALLKAIAMKRDDEDAVTLEVRDTIRYASIIAPALKLSQADLFGSVDDRPLKPKVAKVVAAWEAETIGYTAGLNGGERSDERFPEGSALAVEYFKGFMRGQAVIAARMEPGEKKVDQSLTKRRGGKMAAAADDSNDTTDVEPPAIEPENDPRQVDLEDHTNAPIH